ncbi:MAG: hypothetical protein D6805_04985 [Planctomycetota bacterium]|nr:MAG: hypothetical protein D6805_04985 [Planctomycetota bacterium]
MARFTLPIWLILPTFLLGCRNPILLFSSNPAPSTKVSIPAYAALTCAIRHSEEGKLQEAAKWLEIARKADPSSVEILKWSGDILIQLGHTQEGLDWLHQASELAKKNYNQHLDIAQIYQKHGYLFQALQEYYRTLTIRPNLTYPTKEILKLLHLLHQPQIAIPLLERLIPLTHEKRRLQVYLALSQNFREAQKPEVALQVLRNLDLQYPKSAELKLEFIRNLYALQRYTYALKYVQNALIFHPHYPYFYYYMGLILKKLKKNKSAQLVFQRLIEILKSPPPSQKKFKSFKLSQRFNLLGKVYFQLGREQEAVKCLFQSLSIDKSNRNAILILTQHLLKKGQYKLVVALLENYLSAVPQDKEIKGELAYIYSKIQLSLDKAIQYSLEALEVYPTNSRYLYALGWAYFQKSRFEMARSFLNQAVEIGENLEAKLALGYLNFCLGDLARSKKWYQSAQKQLPQNPYIQNMLQQIQALEYEFRKRVK